MKSLTKNLVFLSCLLPLIATASECLPRQGPITFNDNFWNPEPKWICPKGQLIIDFNSNYSNNKIEEYITLTVRNGSTENVKLTLKKYDPDPNPQIQLVPNIYFVQEMTLDITPGTVYFPPFTTGNLAEGGHKRTLTITNDSPNDICLSKGSCP